MISYQLDTIGIEKLVKLQFKNAGFESGGINDSINFQVWLFEFGTKVQVRIGKCYVQNWQPILNIDSPAVGVILDTDSVNYIGGFLNGSTTNPNFNYDYGKFTTVPAEGTVYEFYYLPNGVKDVRSNNEFEYLILDNHIEINVGSNTNLIAARLFDLLGREIEASKNSILEIHSVPSGIYLLRVETEMGYLTKCIKID